MAEYKHDSTTLLVEQDKLIFKHRISDGESLQLTVVSAASLYASHVSAAWCVKHSKSMAAWWRGAMAAVTAFMPALCKDLLALHDMDAGTGEVTAKCRMTAAHFEVAIKTLLDVYVNES